MGLIHDQKIYFVFQCGQFALEQVRRDAFGRDIEKLIVS